ncbi:D-hexose-6-phosphate mutarotase [Georgenia yuyongxinii]|uniref:Putative glucose-6-phosphate 1-epimerase n=1 Tax=Georgenia yuyongxinii TaxID=2589797 RepID=A0A5B8C334_9MICO|nr:D-hexose-6-phosphate mutarotase [Georgenia yuyongxinii]QDC24460.1 D-hexose-6-phosphate mutarotase [Georgenia yuyongxinii]
MPEDLIAVDLPASVTRTDGEGGLPVLRVSTPVATGEVYLHGAHVSAYTPAGQDPVIWMSKASMFAAGQPIRGGVPVCFPWFGAGREAGMAPAHGFARLADWTLVGADDADGVVRLTFRLTDTDVAALPGVEAWAHGFELTYVVTFGPELTLALSVRNTSGEEYSFEEALHTYFHVKDATAVTVEGLDGASYLDKAPGAGTDRLNQSGPVAFTGETDRVYVSTGTAVAVDPGSARTITVAKESSANTVVWNPWAAKAAAMADYDDAEWPTMVCVETANALEHAITLGADQSHTMTARISVAPKA